MYYYIVLGPHLGQVSRMQVLCVNVLPSIDVAIIAAVQNRVSHGSPGISSLKRDKRSDMSSRS